MGVIITESVEELISNEESIEKNKKQQEYLEYIKKHVLNVQRAFLNCFVPLLEKTYISNKISDEELKAAINRAALNIPDHDASKYSDEEFDGYREKYYPTVTELANPEFQSHVYERSERAWESHYKHNWHHPYYWVDEKTGEPIDMNLEAIIEMICDWISFGDDTREWYNTKAHNEKAAMTDKTKEIVEELFDIINR